MVAHKHGTYRGKRGKGGGILITIFSIVGICYICSYGLFKIYEAEESEEDAQNNADSADASKNTVEATLTDEEVVKILTDKRLLIKQLKGKHGELRSLILGLVIPSLTLCSLTILWMVTRGHQVDRKLENLEQNVQTREGNMEKIKKEITNQLMNELSHSENDEKKIEGENCNIESPKNNDLYNSPPTNIITTFHRMKEARPVTFEDVEMTEARMRTGSGLVVADIE